MPGGTPHPAVAAAGALAWRVHVTARRATGIDVRVARSSGSRERRLAGGHGACSLAHATVWGELSMRAIGLAAAVLAIAWTLSLVLGSEHAARERGARYAPAVATAEPLPAELRWDPPTVSVETMYGAGPAR